MKNLKDNIWIEGFDDKYKCEDKKWATTHSYTLWRDIVYTGKTSDIPEEIANGCVDCFKNEYYLDYSSEIKYLYEFKTAKESIQSACSQEYCIIFKK